MRSSISAVPALLLITCVLSSGCSTTMQTTSGRDWLAAVPASQMTSDGSVSQDRADLNRRIREAAAVEPILRFPARIGVVKIGPVDGSRVDLIPATVEEAEAWAEAADNLGPRYGEFVPISPLIAAMLRPERHQENRMDNAAEVIETIRIAAARQHLDAVIIYEVDATTNTRDTALSIADWTLIGAVILPTQGVNARGIAQAMLLDVRNGYHYGTVRVSADDDGMTTRFRSSEAQEDLAEHVKEEAVTKLAGETEAFIRELRLELMALDSPAGS